MPIIIDEYRSATIPGLSDRDVSYLKKPCFIRDEKHKPYEILQLADNKSQIRNTSYAGLIQLENERIHFSTKVKANLFYMLSLLKDEDAFCYDSEMLIEIKEGKSFFDILGRLFLNELEHIFKKGFYKKYVHREESIEFLRGKLLVGKQIQNDIRKNVKFVCSYSNLTFDNIENQIILRATDLLIPLIRFNENIRSDLLRFSHLLREEVTLRKVVPEDCNKVQFSRLNDYYRPIIQFSRAILQNYFIRSTSVGESMGFNFIVNMNKVYEDFVTELIEEVVEEEGGDYALERQERYDSLVRERRIIIRPDVILRKKNTDQCPYIIDAKYKKQESNSDYFQVIAYALAIPSVTDCYLIYPQDEDIDILPLTIDTRRFGHSRGDITLHTIKIDLLLSEDYDFQLYITKMKQQLKRKLNAVI
jgi:5-methylcytosine-specific restriction enzyme subunit McrC